MSQDNKSPLADNPPRFDSRAEIADFLKEQGHDAHDIGRDAQVLEGNAITHDWADDPVDDRGGREDFDLALEWERLEDRAEERGLDLSQPELDDDLPGWLEGF